MAPLLELLLQLANLHNEVVELLINAGRTSANEFSLRCFTAPFVLDDSKNDLSERYLLSQDLHAHFETL